MFDIKTAVQDGALQIQMFGSLDMGGVDLFEEVTSKIQFAEAQSVYIDMQDMIFIDSTGIGALINFTRQLGDKQFEFINVSEEVKEIFSIIGIEDLLS